MMDELTTDAIALVDRACQLSGRLLQRQRADVDDRVRMTMLAHTLRMLRYAEAAVIVARSGKLEPACALIRPLLEMGWVLLSIQADPARFEEWVKQGHGQQVKAIGSLLTDWREEERPADSAEDFGAEVAGLPAGTPYQAFYWAERSGAKESYSTLYRRLSDASHAGPIAAAAYLDMDGSTGMPIGVCDPQLEELPADCLTVAAALLLDALRYLAGPSMIATELREVEALEALARQLQARVDVVGLASRL